MKRVAHALVFLAIGCAAPVEPDGKTRTTNIIAPDQGQFQASVSPMLEKKCASLDCHGSAGRPLRLFSARGLRAPNDGGLIPGVGETTPEETTANYRAVIGLEPEQMSRAACFGIGQCTQEQSIPARDLLILSKPLDLVQHKGGRVFATNDPAEVCLISWITGALDSDACSKAAAQY